MAASIFTGCSNTSTTPIGLVTASQTFKPGVYKIEPSASLDSAILTVHGDNLVLDFEGVVYDARSFADTPSEFKGIAIRVENSKNVTIKNLRAHGFKIAIYAESVENLKILDCDLSYNYRPELFSKWDREALSDWLYYHQNDDDEWLRYGGAIYLKRCYRPLVKGVTITQVFNGLMMVECDLGTIYNNDIRFNSGLGIGMYRSSYNKVMHNRLDWNVRGYSHGKYDRGQDSAGILLYEQCNNNVIAFNSATHCGDGLFLWAGQSTMDSGEGGCNNNMIYRNDFSHSVANGIEATFSSNIMAWNKLNDCRYGVWAGYSHHSLIINNEIKNCDYGIAIEHGNNNSIIDNTLNGIPLGIKLWERATQPDDWGFASNRDVSSRQYFIEGNRFEQVEQVFEIESTDTLLVYDNVFEEVADKKIMSTSNSHIVTGQQVERYAEVSYPSPLEDGMSTRLEEHYPRGRQYILMNNWGPYNFAYPEIFLRSRETERDDVEYTFAMFGPTANWKLLGARGFTYSNPKSGSIPATIVTARPLDSASLGLEYSYHGPGFISQLGDTIERGQEVLLNFNAFEPNIEWELQFHNYDDQLSPDALKEELSQIKSRPPAAKASGSKLNNVWWRSPAQNVNSDAFVTIANAVHDFEEGEYLFTIESDDGVRLYLDGKLVLDNWDIHTPQIDVIELSLSGSHKLELISFDAGGLAVLDLEMRKMH